MRGWEETLVSCWYVAACSEVLEWRLIYYFVYYCRVCGPWPVSYIIAKWPTICPVVGVMASHFIVKAVCSDLVKWPVSSLVEANQYCQMANHFQKWCYWSSVTDTVWITFPSVCVCIPWRRCASPSPLLTGRQGYGKCHAGNMDHLQLYRHLTVSLKSGVLLFCCYYGRR